MTIQFFDGRESPPFGLPHGPFGWAVQAVATRARNAWQRWLQAMHETRRQQAAIELAKYSPLICDGDTGLSFYTKAHRDTDSRD